MKIGIISMQRVINTGSFLQAYGLKNVLEELGHTVTFIDIPNPNNSSKQYTPYVPKWKRKLKLFRTRLTENHREYLRAKRWDLFVYDLFAELGCGLVYNFNTKDYDIVLIGSDEVFNCTQEDTYWFKNLLLFGQGVECSEIVSYAASFGYTTIERLDKFNIKKDVSTYLKKMNKISVRDINSYNIVKELIGETPYINIDPVLVYAFDNEILKKKRESNYMLIYSYDNRLVETEYVNEIKKYAHSHNLKMISVNFYLEWCDKNVVIHPFEVLRYFRDAYCVVTDTFHGAVMSIKYQKNFVVILRESNKEKLGFLMEEFNLQSRVIDKASQIENVLNSHYKDEMVMRKITDEREKAKNYLSSIGVKNGH